VGPRERGEKGERGVEAAEAAAGEEKGGDDGRAAEERGVAEDAAAHRPEGRGGGAGVDRVQRARDGRWRRRAGRAERRRQAGGLRHDAVLDCDGARGFRLAQWLLKPLE